MPTAAGWARMVEAFRAGLRQHGYIEGKNVVIEFRWAEGKYERLPALANELVRLQVDVIVTHATAGVRAAKEATTSIPIVIAATGDAVSAGLVESLARPGGNITGSSFLGPTLAAKRLDLLREALPHVKRIGLVYNTGVGAPGSVQSVIDAAISRGLMVHRAGVGSVEELEGAFSGMAQARVDAVLVNEDPMLVSSAKRIVELSTRQRLPTMGFSQIAEAGGLMAFGASIVEMHRRAAYFVDRILRGAKPADLPVEQPTTFELLINAKAAAALGTPIARSVLARADRILE
ncbi:MAG TPA: ABC transporter substrate-binding protein [Burkholderiales bacterium]|nr:ABC transporter substrate-binding protein [Burkholderiales bacterium]